jgi:2-keto-4-pentenoate hydratase
MLIEAQVLQTLAPALIALQEAMQASGVKLDVGQILARFAIPTLSPENDNDDRAPVFDENPIQLPEAA